MRLSLGLRRASRVRVAEAGASPIFWIAGAVAAVFALPPAIFAALVRYRFDYLNPSWYLPYEEATAAFVSLEAGAIWFAPLFSMNMSSGDILSNIYTLGFGQAILSLLLGTIMGLALFRHVHLRRVCAAKTRGGATATGSGLLATVTASSTGIMGCCGSSAGLGGGIIALAGLGSLTAAELGAVSPFVQLGMIGVFAALERRWARRIATSS